MVTFGKCALWRIEYFSFIGVTINLCYCIIL